MLYAHSVYISYQRYEYRKSNDNRYDYRIHSRGSIKNDAMRHLEDLIAALRMSNSEFANVLGISPSAVSDMIHGRVRKISGSVARLIEYKYDVNPEWLQSGEGEMFLHAEHDPSRLSLPDRTSTFRWPVSDDECIRIFKSLPDEDRREIRSFVGWRAAIRSMTDSDHGKETIADEIPEPSAPDTNDIQR